MGITTLNKTAAEALFDVAELFEMEHPDDCHPEMNVVTGNEKEC